MYRSTTPKIMIFGLLFLLGPLGALQGAVIVPDDFGRIQDALFFAPPEETLIIVRPGLYVENIDFHGRAITVRSDADGDSETFDPEPETTIIDGNWQGSVVTFATGEGADSVIQGFTLTRGSGSGGANGNGGGGVYCEDSSPTITGNIIEDNWAGGDGGGILCRIAPGHPIITSNIIARNTAGRDGGGIACGTLHVTITNNTIYENIATESGGAIYNWSSPVKVTNSILWENHAPDSPIIFTSPNGLTDVTYCDVQGGWPGTGNIDADPLFVDPVGGDFHLFFGSACMDQGDNGATSLPEQDVDGEDRVGYETVDMGADECYRTELLVPEQYATIQAAIDASMRGYLVTVAPGTYVEHLDFDGKAIVVRSSNPNNSDIVARTIIDGGGNWTVVTFASGEGVDSVLKGFTITQGNEVWGGGISCFGSSPTIANNIIENNRAYSTGVHVGRGGGIYCNSSSPVIKSNIIRENTAIGIGSGIFCDSNSSPEITNNMIVGNTADSFGGGIYCEFNSSPEITNNTIAENGASIGGGGLYCSQSTPVVTNTILWDNSAPLDPEIFGTPTVTYCDVQGGWAGTGNIDADPLFVNPMASDFHLTLGSPCIEVGDNAALFLPELDFEGHPRLVEGVAPSFGSLVYPRGHVPFPIVDIGADEYCDPRIFRTYR